MNNNLARSRTQSNKRARAYMARSYTVRSNGHFIFTVAPERISLFFYREGHQTKRCQGGLLPHFPVLYPNAPQVRELSANDAAALSAFYIVAFVGRPREGLVATRRPIPRNIFNAILHNSDKSLELALVCIDQFELDRQFPPNPHAIGTISSRIERSLLSAAPTARKHHIARFEAKAAKSAQPRRGA